MQDVVASLDLPQPNDTLIEPKAKIDTQSNDTLIDPKAKTKTCQEGELDILKLERQLDKLKTLVEDKQQMAIQGQALFNEARLSNFGMGIRQVYATIASITKRVGKYSDPMR